MTESNEECKCKNIKYVSLVPSGVYALLASMCISIGILAGFIVKQGNNPPGKPAAVSPSNTVSTVSVSSNDVHYYSTQTSVCHNATNILWTAAHPVVALYTTNGLTNVPATGCELGLREDGVLVWRLANVHVNTNNTDRFKTEKKKKWFGW